MSKKSKTVACVLVTTPKVFTWLGHLPVLNWCARQLEDVRGIDHVVCVAAPALVERAGKLLRPLDIEVVSIPAALAKQGSDKAIDKWLCAANGPAADADVVAVLRPINPFLPAAKIEACIDVVIRNIADASSTVRELPTLTQNVEGGPVTQGVTHITVPGCRAFAPERVIEQVITRRFRPVTVSLIESLDVNDCDDMRVASALVAGGTV